MERRLPLHDFHARTAAQMIKGGGDYIFPSQYTGATEEHLNTRANAGMQDLSSMGEIDLKGPGAERLLHRLLVNEIKDLAPGQMRYSTVCNEQGGIVDDVTVYKFNDEHFMLVTSSGPRKQTVKWFQEQAVGSAAYVTDISAAVALPVVQGPRSRDVLKATVADPAALDALKFFRFTRTTIGDTDVILSRSGYTGELGFELYTPAEEAAGVWDAVLKAGRDFGLLPYGVLTMQSLRIEKGYPLYGPDITLLHTPYHLGLERFIKFEKRDFIGREALLRLQERGIDTRWVGLVVDAELPLKPGDRLYAVQDVAVFKDEIDNGPDAGSAEDRLTRSAQAVGAVTSSARGHSVGKVLALGHVGIGHAYTGARLAAVIGGRVRAVTVSALPFFDPGNARLKA
ncbi:MAG: aminomethyltransferase family protein [Anaerolineales bacterium]|nr:aminomethyltransferase family protein [Anaerolineales bacterium]